MQKLKMYSPDLSQGNIARIRELFPNCVTEAHDANGLVVLRVDFDLLRQELSGELVEGPQERYRLDWPGKRQAMLTANSSIAKSLRPCRKESVEFDTTENVYIEGDNLEVLKLLQESYLGKVKMIYIDPPYNTGNDFIYKDDFAEEAGEFLRNDGQYDDEGKRMVQNFESNGRFHSDWLSMMYQRLRVARNLMADDGVIFISIDDNEVAALIKICDEIFGAKNFIADLIWANREGGGSSDSKLFRIKHEHILCFSKNIDQVIIVGVPVANEERYKLSDEYVATRGKYYLQKMGMGTIQYSVSLDYPITTPDGATVMPADNNGGRKACWRWSKPKYEWGIKNGFIEIKKDSAGMWTVYSKQYLKCDNEGNIITRTQRPMGIIDEYSSTQAAKLLENMGLGSVFSYAKPTELIKYLCRCITNQVDIIFDFFSGSATTAHAVMQLNAEDGGKRKFIMVQLPEVCAEGTEVAKAGYKNICEIGKERIRRAGKKIKEEKPLATSDLDIGFRVLKVKPSCMADVYYTPDETKQRELGFFENINSDATQEDLLFQVLTDWGVELHLPIAPKTIQGKTVFFVDENSLAACFDSGLNDNFIKELATHKPVRAVFRDSGFADDATRINAEQIFKQLSPDTEVRVL